MEPIDDIELGDFVTDTVTGFSGMVIGRSVYLSEATRIQVQPTSKDSTRLPRAEWIPISRLVLDNAS